MEGILKEVGLDSLIPQFSAERIEPANVAALTDEELSRLGVRTIGDRLRLRDLCTASEKERTRESAASNVLQECMALFNGRNSRRADRKRKAVAKRSWTVSFVCIADGYQSKIPTSTEKQVLFQAGLGIKKIKLDLEDDEHGVLEKITCGDKGDDGEIKGFPQLKECRGFEIMYCISGCKELKPLNCCCSAKELKSNVGAQAKLYLRPIQKNLSTVSLVPQNMSKVKERCNICHREVLMKDLRAHVFMCKSKEGLLSSDSDEEGLRDPAFSLWRLPGSTTLRQHGQYQSPNNAGSSSLSGDPTVPAAVVNLVDDSSNPACRPGEVPERTTSEQQSQHQNPSDSGRSSVLGDLTLPAAVVNLDNGNDNQLDEVNTAALSVDDIVDKVVAYCLANNIHNPVEILRCLQKELVIGQALEVTDITQCKSGLTNFILVNRDSILDTAFDELKSYNDYRLTLEVQFYDEVSAIFI